jgi:ABC-type lipoprotein export system ATPase subunit
LLNAIGGLDNIDSGTITIDGQRITDVSSGRTDVIRNAHIGYIFQSFNLLDDRTVFDNVAIALQMTGITDSDTVTARVRYCLEKTGIDQYRNKLAGSLSGGQRQRVAIARAIVKNPDIIIADEPTGNLDSANTLEVMNIIKAISREKLVILVTHEENLANFYADRIIRLRDGKVVSDEVNENAAGLDYRIENRIYLKDIEDQRNFEDDDYSIRVFNDSDKQTTATIALPGFAAKASMVELDGRHICDLAIKDGRVEFTLPAFRIATVRFE